MLSQKTKLDKHANILQVKWVPVTVCPIYHKKVKASFSPCQRQCEVWAVTVLHCYVVQAGPSCREVETLCDWLLQQAASFILNSDKNQIAKQEGHCKESFFQSNSWYELSLFTYAFPDRIHQQSCTHTHWKGSILGMHQSNSYLAKSNDSGTNPPLNTMQCHSHHWLQYFKRRHTVITL